MRYWVDIGGRTLEASVEADATELDGKAHSARIGAVGTSPLRIMVLDGRSYEIVATAGDKRGGWRLSLWGERFDVHVEDERQHAIRAALGHSGPSQTGGTIRAPMPGLVVRVLVEEGQLVSVGTGVVVVEAMKMENELTAGVAGTVRRIHAVPGAPVDKGQALVEIEADAAR